MFSFKKTGLLVLPLIASMGLTACFGEYRHDLIAANSSTFFKGYEERDEQMREALAGTDIVFDMTRFTDRRVPEAYSTYEPNIVIHTYDPDRLPGNAPAFIRAVMDETLGINKNVSNPDRREVFFELRDVDLRILGGNFISGEFGRYYARINADVIVRSGQGKVLVDQPYEIKFETVRQSFTGSHPTAEEDWHDMSRTVKMAIHYLAFNIMKDTLDASGTGVYDGKVKDHPERISPEAFAE